MQVSSLSNLWKCGHKVDSQVECILIYYAHIAVAVYLDVALLHVYWTFMYKLRINGIHTVANTKLPPQSYKPKKLILEPPLTKPDLHIKIKKL